MGLAEELTEHTDEIVQRWYEKWQGAERSHPEISEAALKDKLPVQLRTIGEQIARLRTAENPSEMWHIPERLDPEERIAQELPIEEVVQEYAVAVDAVRDWIEERDIDVPFREYSYFYTAIFELTAESVRRYAAREAENIRRDRAHYLARVMHQLRTPLSAILLAAELAETKLATRLKRNVHRISVLVDSILRLERYRPEETPVVPSEIEVARMVDDIVEDSQAEARNKQLRIEREIDPALRITVDRDLFHDALGNLVQNAIKFTQAGYVRIEAEPRRDTVLVRVRDSGPGMTQDQLRTLFEQPQPGSRGGAGIGLQIVRHAARSLGGSVEVESEPGKGSCFTLCVPRRVSPRP